MRINKIGKIKYIDIEMARELSDILNKNKYRTETVKSDLNGSYELNVYEECKRTKRWWCYLAW